MASGTERSGTHRNPCGCVLPAPVDGEHGRQLAVTPYAQFFRHKQLGCGGAAHRRRREHGTAVFAQSLGASAPAGPGCGVLVQRSCKFAAGLARMGPALAADSARRYVAA